MKSKFLTGLLIGAAAGAVLGILFAPAKGSETRKKLKQKGEDLEEELKEKLNEWGGVIEEKIKNYRQTDPEAESR